MSLDGSSLLAKIRAQYPLLSLLFESHENAINLLATNTGTSATGTVPPPDTPEAINVAAGGGHAQIVVTHNSPVQRGVNYVTEYSTEPTFLQPHVLDHGCSRTGTVSLPDKNANGDQYSYYFRSMAQYPGSKATLPVFHGTQTAPTAVHVGGTGQYDLIPSTGAGTALANGTQGGQGLGSVVFRPAIGPKSQVGKL